MKKIIWYFFLTIPFAVGAQKSRPTVDYMAAIHFNPGALAQLDHNFLIGAEFRVAPRATIVTEVGYIFASDYTGHHKEINRASGLMIRPSIRFYMNERKNFYLQPQLFFKMVTHHLHDWIGMDCVNDVPGYEELRDFRYQRRIFGFNITGGYLVSLSKSGNTFLDFYFGAGMRYKTVRIQHVPNACYNNGNIFMRISNDNVMAPSLPSGIKLVIVVE